jgi:hypothetical protein
MPGPRLARNSDRLADSCFAQGMVHIGATPCVAFDPHGLIFAVATQANTIRLYDSTNFDKVSARTRAPCRALAQAQVLTLTHTRTHTLTCTHTNAHRAHLPSFATSTAQCSDRACSGRASRSRPMAPTSSSPPTKTFASLWTVGPLALPQLLRLQAYTGGCSVHGRAGAVAADGLCEPRPPALGGCVHARQQERPLWCVYTGTGTGLGDGMRECDGRPFAYP